MRFSLLSLPLLLSLAVAGCSMIGNNKVKVETPQLVAAPDKVSLMLADAADRAAKSLEVLAAVEQERTPAASVAPIANAPLELRRAITVSWTGPVEPITKKIAGRSGYEFLSLGSAPPVPVIVTLDVQNKPVIDVLRDIGLQLGKRGDLVVDGTRKVIEVHYLTGDNG